MGILGTIWFMAVLRPFYIFQDGVQKLSKFLDERDAWDQFLYYFLIGLCVLVLILVSMGFPIR